MSEQVAWHVELAVKPSALEDFRALTGEMVEATRGEPGVLSYERFVSADGMVVHVYERYADSAAAVAHLRTFGRQFGDRFVDLVVRFVSSL
jgi:quinol monooxygenase YgiN